MKIIFIYFVPKYTIVFAFSSCVFLVLPNVMLFVLIYANMSILILNPIT